MLHDSGKLATTKTLSLLREASAGGPGYNVGKSCCTQDLVSDEAR